MDGHLNVEELVEEGSKLMAEGKTKKAMELFEKVYYLGSSAANYPLGVHYLEKNTADDVDKAIVLLERAANDGNVQAIDVLADIYEYGRNQIVEPNAEKCLLYHHKAIEQGVKGRWVILSNLHHRGIRDLDAGVYLLEPSLTKSIECLVKAVETGDSGAMVTLGGLYETGSEDGTIQKDFHKAMQLYERSAALNNGDAYFTLGTIYESGFENIIAKDSNKASENYKKASSHGNMQAYFKIQSKTTNEIEIPEPEEL